MKFSVDKSDNYTLFRLQEENLNSLISPNLKSEFVLLNNGGIKNLIFDMSEIKYVDSSGLSAILTANRLWKGQGHFILTGAESPAVKKLIEISRLESILNIMPSVQESVDFIFLEEIEQKASDSEEE